MTENRLGDYLDPMRQAAADALVFVEGLSKEEFFDDKRTQQAVIMSLVIIGEAATKIMDRSPRRTLKCLGAACGACAIASLTDISISILMLYGKRFRQRCQSY